MTPRKAVGHWTIGRIRRLVLAPQGIFNETYSVKSESGIYILQKLHPIIAHTDATKNYALVTKFLRSRGLKSQHVVETKTKKLTVHDGNRSWRLLEAVPGQTYARVKGNRMAYEAGRCLGEFHNAMSRYRGELRTVWPSLQSRVVLKKLIGHKKKLLADSNVVVREATQFLLTKLPKYFLPSNLPKRIIHKDPKISNFVFDKRGRAIAMIDLDTVQRLSPLYDLGDALRSICGGEEDDPKNKFNREIYKIFLSGYRVKTKKFLSTREWRLVPRATALIMLTLAARFLNDYVDDNYFGWDPKRYPSRKAHNLARAFGQIALYKNFEKKMMKAPSKRERGH